MEPCPTGHRKTHLVTRHGWTQCPDCDLCGPPEHNYIKCIDCRRDIPAEQYEGHLRNVHGKKDCPFCKETCLDVARLREHILQRHGPYRACPQCSELQTEDTLSSHLQRQHSWVICGFCSRAFSDSPKMENHKQLEHDPKACSVCQSVMPAALLPSHLVQKHRYVVCPPRARPVDDCGAKSPSGHGPMREDLGKEQTGRRVAGGKEVRDKSGRCVDCARYYQYLQDHRRKQHGDRRKRVLVERRVRCVKGNGVTHSLSNVSRCGDCKRMRQSQRRRTVVKS